MKKRVLALVLALVLVCTLVHVAAGAKENSTISIELPDKITIRVNEVRTLRPTLLPVGSIPEVLLWQSSNTDIVTVVNAGGGDTGNITGIKPGSAVVTATASNGLTASCTVTVINQIVPQSIEIPKSITLQVLQKVYIEPILTPAGALTLFSFRSEDTSIARASGGGGGSEGSPSAYIVGVSPGTTTIEFISKEGLTAKCKVIVIERTLPLDVTIPQDIYIRVGGSFDFTPQYLPSNSVTQDSVSSSDPKIVRALRTGGGSGVRLYGHNVGTSIVTLSSVDGIKTDTYVTVYISKCRDDEHDLKIVDEEIRCTDGGHCSYYQCNLCGKWFYDPNGENVIAEKRLTKTAPIGHDYEDTTTAPTCTERGYTTHECSRCGDSKTDTYVNALGHSTEIKNAKAATCTASGYTGDEVCKRCSKIINTGSTIAALGHDYKSTVTASTCTERGYTTHKCTRCGDSKVDSYVNALGHNIELRNVRPATETQKGYTGDEVCTRCGLVTKIGNDIPVLTHTHSWDGGIITTQPTCQNDGVKTYTCKSCGERKTEKIKKTDSHKYISTVVKPTCASDGYTRYECSVCHKMYTDNATKATGHKLKRVITPAQYRKTGSIVSTCTVCGEQTTTKISRIQTVKLSKTTFVRDGKAHTPTVTVKDYSGKTLKKGTDYTVKYQSGRKNIGTYKVTITFKGNYSGKKVLTFKITPAKVTGLKATAGKKQAKVTWSKVNYATTYVVYYSTAKNGTYKKAGTTNKLTLTKTKLTTGKTYYFKVKAGKKTDSGTVVYGPLSAPKAVKIK